MDTTAVGSSASNLLAQSAQSPPEAAEVKKSGADNNGASNDRGVEALKSATAPSVNTSGQKTGQIVNVTA